MKQIIQHVESCKDCPNLVGINDHTYCGVPVEAAENPIEDVDIIPDWCPLPDAPPRTPVEITIEGFVGTAQEVADKLGGALRKARGAKGSP